MKRGKGSRTLSIVSMVMAGGLFLSMNAGNDRVVEIDTDCQVDYDLVNLSLHKAHRVKWKSTQAFNIDFANPSPCPNGVSHFSVSNHHDSGWCGPIRGVHAQDYPYTISRGATVCSDPGVRVKDGRDDDSQHKNNMDKKPQ
jgi:hypothetical protein